MIRYVVLRVGVVSRTLAVKQIHISHELHMHTSTLIGASLSEPHINGTALRILYIFYGTSDCEMHIPRMALWT